MARVAVVGATGAVGHDDARSCCASARSRPTRSSPSPPRARPGASSTAATSRRSTTSRSQRLRHRAVLGRRRRPRASGRPRFVAAGATVIDNSSAFRRDPESRSSSPRSTRTRSSGHHGLIANPNCSTMQLMVALAPIHRAAGIERLIVSTYQSVSGTGARAIEELDGQAHAVAARRWRCPRPRSTPSRSPST